MSALALWLLCWAGPATAADADRGAHLAGLAGCEACHTAQDGAPYAGGHAIKTKFGTFYGSNLTPDPDHGLGGWSAEDFERAMRRGRGPDGHAYWPAFPYTSFTRTTDAELADIWAYLQSLPADGRPNTPHDTERGRWQLGLWRRLAFSRRGPSPTGLTPTKRGEHLVDAVGHCGECHSPRSAIGRVRWRRGLAGNPDPPVPAPDIRAQTLGWSLQDWTTFLEIGMLPSGDFTGGEMARIIGDGTAPLPAADRNAMAVFLQNSSR